MVLAAGTSLEKAEELKTRIKELDAFDDQYRYEKRDGMIWFPVTKRFEYPGAKFEERDLPEKVLQPSWREAARDILTEEEHAHGTFSYDTVGTIAIVEVPEALEHKERELAQLLLDSDKTISTVLKKGAGHEGALRTQPMIYLAGDDVRETVVSENGVRLKVHVEDVYYSVRLGTERNRIMKLIRPGERVLCLFSGAGPYPVVFAKNTGAAEIVGVELNPRGHVYAEENVRLNKVSNVQLYCGDAKEVVPQLEGLFDRITMPLPHTGEEFLPIALGKVADGGVIHYYTFIDKGTEEEERKRVSELVEEHGKTAEEITYVQCGQHSPRRYRVCYDVKVTGAAGKTS